MNLYTVQPLPISTVVQSRGPTCEASCATYATWSERGAFRGGMCLQRRPTRVGDSRVFGRKDWMATRGGNLAVTGKVSTVWERGGRDVALAARRARRRR